MVFFRLRRGTSWLMRLARVGAAFVMGLAISPGSFCTGAGTTEHRWFALTIGVAAAAVLAIITILLVYDSHLESRSRKHCVARARGNA